jgi:ABC-type Fe3+/spermidine/putrescine transport system ATPase subunit
MIHPKPDELSWHNLNIENPSKNKSILCKLNGKISSGEFLTIMGPSGSGKTTFLQSITARTNLPKGYLCTGKVN